MSLHRMGHSCRSTLCRRSSAGGSDQMDLETNPLLAASCIPRLRLAAVCRRGTAYPQHPTRCGQVTICLPLGSSGSSVAPQTAHSVPVATDAFSPARGCACVTRRTAPTCPANSFRHAWLVRRVCYLVIARVIGPSARSGSNAHDRRLLASNEWPGSMRWLLHCALLALD